MWEALRGLSGAFPLGRGAITLKARLNSRCAVAYYGATGMTLFVVGEPAKIDSFARKEWRGYF